MSDFGNICADMRQEQFGHHLQILFPTIDNLPPSLDHWCVIAPPGPNSGEQFSGEVYPGELLPYTL